MSSGPDRISSMPDEVLCHILSFLPMENVVATSVLSKRWLPLRHSVSVIDLNDHNLVSDDATYYQFHSFVFSVLLSRDVNQPIKKFILKWHFDDSHVNHINTWLKVVLQRGVEHLELVKYFDLYFRKLPKGILSCNTLVSLNLRGLYVRDFSSAQLPLLKILHLYRVELAEENASSFQLPSLVTLELDSVTISKGSSLVELLVGCPNLEELEAVHVRPELDERLEKVKNLTKLTKASVTRCANLKLKAFYNVKCLSLVIDEASLDYNKIPTFYNLEKVELKFDQGYRWSCLLELLNHCPKLQILDMESWRFSNEEYWPSPKSDPECVSSHLRKCIIHRYNEDIGELLFARYIMQKASVLETMRIICDDRWSGSAEKLEMEENLSLYERLSSTCQLSFE